jgi:Putative transposase
MEQVLFAGIDYRHVIFTVPEQLRGYIEQCPRLLGELAKAGVATLTIVMSRAAGRELKVGVVAVIQTAGRASNYNPHVHMMVTGGGIDQQGQWQDAKTVSYDYLHREWQRQLFARLEETSRSAELAQLLKRLRQEYNRGLVAYWEPKPVKTGKGLARYLIKYVASPPIAVSRIIAYDGQSLEYCWQDHKSHQQERARVSAVEFIRRLVQHILPRGFQRVRYYGLHAVSIRGQILEPVRRAIGAALQLAFSFGEMVMSKLGWRAKIKRKFGKDPLLCERCGTKMVLWKVWTPTSGVVYYLPDDAPEWREVAAPAKPAGNAQLSFGF